MPLCVWVGAVFIGACKLPPEGVPLDHVDCLGCLTGVFFMQIYDSSEAQAYIKTQFYAAWCGLYLLVYRRETNTANVFLLTVKRWNKLRKLSASTPKPQPTRAAWPNRLCSYSLSPTPSPSLLSLPLTLLGPVTLHSSAPTLSLYKEFFGYVAPYLIWLLSQPVRPSPVLIRQWTVYTFDLDVRLHFLGRISI